MTKKNWLILLMILVPIVGYLFNIYALFLILPLGLYKLKINMKKLILIIVIAICILNFIYTFGYQGPPMTQFEFLTRTLGSIAVGTVSFVYYQKLTK